MGGWLLVKFPVIAGRSPMGRGSGRDGREFSRGRGRGRGFGRGDQEDVLEYPYESENEDTTANVRMMVTHIEGKLDSPEKVQDKKRLKKSEEPQDTEIKMASSASSLEEGRRAQ